MSSVSRMTLQALRDCAIIVALTALALGIGHFTRRARTNAPDAPHRLVIRTHEPASPPPNPGTLRVCADPNNLPFSNQREQGFENVLANLVAADLGRRVSYYWQPQRRGFIR